MCVFIRVPQGSHGLMQLCDSYVKRAGFPILLVKLWAVSWQEAAFGSTGKKDTR